MVKIDPEVLVNKNKNKAEEILKDPDKLNKLMKDATKKSNKGGPINEIAANLKLLMGLVSDYTNGKYRKIPYGSLIMIVVAIIYFVSPIDLIPDFIPVAGFVDDAAVLAFVIKQISSDLQDYKIWKGN